VALKESRLEFEHVVAERGELARELPEQVCVKIAHHQRVYPVETRL
jgi:hypothetical protein